VQKHKIGKDEDGVLRRQAEYYFLFRESVSWLETHLSSDNI